MNRFFRNILFAIVCALFASGCNRRPAAMDYVNVTAESFQLALDHSQMIRSDMDVSLSVENTGDVPLVYDTVDAIFCVQENVTCQVKRKLDKPVTIKGREKHGERLKGNFGLFEAHQGGREVMVSLLRGGEVVFGPIAIAVPVELKP